MNQIFLHYGFNESRGIAANLVSAKESRKAGTPQHLAAIVFIAFTYESALNHLGQLALSSFEEHFERLSPEAKLNLLSDHAGLKPDFSNSPYQSFVAVFKIRNALAHLRQTEMKVSNEVLKQPKKWPRPIWMSQARGLDAARTLADLDKVIQQLEVALNITLPPRFILTELRAKA